MLLSVIWFSGFDILVLLMDGFPHRSCSCLLLSLSAVWIASLQSWYAYVLIGYSIATHRSCLYGLQITLASRSYIVDCTILVQLISNAY